MNLSLLYSVSRIHLGALIISVTIILMKYIRKAQTSESVCMIHIVKMHSKNFLTLINYFLSFTISFLLLVL